MPLFPFVYPEVPLRVGLTIDAFIGADRHGAAKKRGAARACSRPEKTGNHRSISADVADCEKAATNVEHAICRDTGESAPPAGSSTNSRVAACKGLLDRYRPLANTHPGERPLTVLAQAGAAGFELTGHGDTMLHPGSDLVSWAKGQQPPVTISAQLSESLASDDNAGILQKAPGVPFFVLSRSEGSAGPEKAAFTVGVWKGELENAGVEATP